MEPTQRRRLSGTERRERILEAATQVFAEHGYRDASMGEIATRAGVVASVIYDHFPSKRDLHIELLDRHGESLVARSITAIEPGEPLAMFEKSIQLFFTLVEEDPFAWRCLFRDPPADPEIAETWRRIHGAATTGIAALIEIGAPPGLELHGLERHTAALMLARASQAATNGLAEWWFEHREVTRDQVASLAMALLWEGFERMLARAG